MENLSAADNVAYRDGTGWHPLGAGGAVTGAVRSLAATGTTVYVGTDAKDVAGIPQADNVARWNGSSWSAVGASIAGTDGWFPASTFVNGLAAFGSGLYATGTFQDASGNLRADNVAAFDGAAWHNVGSDGAGNGPWTGTGLALAVFDQTRPDLPLRLYAGGSFPSAGGESLAGRLATYQLTLLPPASTTPPLDTVAPQLRNVDLSVTRFRAARSRPVPLGATRTGIGTRVRFALTERASVRFTVARAAPGRKVGTRCVKPTAVNSGHQSCSRWVRVHGFLLGHPRQGRHRRHLPGPGRRRHAEARPLPAQPPRPEKARGTGTSRRDREVYRSSAERARPRVDGPFQLPQRVNRTGALHVLPVWRD